MDHTLKSSDKTNSSSLMFYDRYFVIIIRKAINKLLLGVGVGLLQWQIDRRVFFRSLDPRIETVILAWPIKCLIRSTCISDIYICFVPKIKQEQTINFYPNKFLMIILKIILNLAFYKKYYHTKNLYVYFCRRVCACMCVFICTCGY